MKFYLVGGAIRDRLLGLEPSERDWVVVGAAPAELEALGFTRLDAEFPVFSHPQSGEEYALARRERKTAPGHKGFVVEFGPDVTLEEDLVRRDLRVNAIAESESGELIDPHDGRTDIESRTLRHVSAAFVEDPLRVLRTARFAARFHFLGFVIHPSTLELMRAMCGGNEMRALSPARIWEQTEKALATDSPARYFTALAECGGLGFVLPEACASRKSGVATSKSWRLVAAALEAAASLDRRVEVRFAALAAAIAVNAGEDAIDSVCARFPLPKKHAQLARVAFKLARDLASAARLRAEQLLEALQNADAFRRGDRFDQALIVCRALDTAGVDGLAGKLGVLQRAYDAAGAVNGADLAAEGFKGSDLARELEQRRRIAIEKGLKGSD